MTTERWYNKWERPFIDSYDERKSFEKWFDDQRKEGKIDPDDSETDYLNNYRDTRTWQDDFFAYAFVMEAEDVKIIEYEKEANR